MPHGVAADAFHAKGSAGQRAAAPIWILGPPIYQGGVLTASVACPECLRTFVHRLREEPKAAEESRCPHCMSPVRLALVQEPQETDRTVLTISVPARLDGKPVVARLAPTPESIRNLHSDDWCACNRERCIEDGDLNEFWVNREYDIYKSCQDR